MTLSVTDTRTMMTRKVKIIFLCISHHNTIKKLLCQPIPRRAPSRAAVLALSVPEKASFSRHIPARRQVSWSIPCLTGELGQLQRVEPFHPLPVKAAREYAPVERKHIGVQYGI